MKVLELFRLLAFLLALHLSSEVDGAPNAVVESGGILTSGQDINQQNVIPDESESKRKDEYTIEEERLPFNEHEKDVGAAELKTRALGDSKSTAIKTQKRKEKTTKTFKNIAEKASDCLKGTKTRQQAPIDPAEDPADQTDAVGDGDLEGASSFPGGSSSPRRLPPTSTFGPSSGFLESEEVRLKRENALEMVRAAGSLLSEHNADPYNDENLYRTINSAFYAYHNTHFRPLPYFRVSDKKTRMAVKLAVLSEILKDLNAPNESQRALEVSSAYHPRPTSPLKPLPLGPTPGFLESEKSRIGLEAAEDGVRVVRHLLSNPSADPYNDKKLSRAIETALRVYKVVSGRSLPKFVKLDDRTRMTIKLAQLERIFEDVDARKGDRKASKKLPGNLDEEMSEIVALGSKKEAAVKVARAAKVALDDPEADPVNDEELIQLIDLAIEKYNKAYGRRPFGVKGLLDKESRTQRKLDEFQKIFDDLEK